MTKKKAIASVVDKLKAPTPSRKDILTAQAGALTTQLGTLRFNYLQQEQQFTTQIANIMREIGVLDAAAPKKTE